MSCLADRDPPPQWTLAYAAIVDGNVLHACFGLKAAANGRGSVPAVGGGGSRENGRSPSVLFCYFPSSSGAMDALQLMLPRLSMNKVRMQNLADILREVRDLGCEEESRGAAATYAAAGSTAKAPLYVRVTRAYVLCFAAVVRYHDERAIIEKDDAVARDKAGRPRVGGIVARCSRALAKFLDRPRTNPRLEVLRRDALGEIAIGFRGLKEDIWQCLENMAFSLSGKNSLRLECNA